MQKLPFETITRSVHLEKKRWTAFVKWLKSRKITFSKWTRDKIEEELKKAS